MRLSGRSEFRNCRAYNVLIYAVSAQALDQGVELWPAFYLLQVSPQPLTNVSPNQRLIAGKPKKGSHAFELLYHVIRHPDGDAGHGPLLAETRAEITALHGSFYPEPWLFARR